MNPFSFLSGLLEPGVTPDAIRSEIFFLGSRHQGEALDGALAELRAPNLEPRRSRLLRAVVSDLTRAQPRARPAR